MVVAESAEGLRLRLAEPEAKNLHPSFGAGVLDGHPGSPFPRPKTSGEVIGTALIEKTGKDVLFKIGDVIGPQSELYQEKERQDPIDMFYAHHYSRTIKVEIPEAYKPAGLEALKMSIKFDFNGKPACGFVSDYKLENNLLTVNISEYYNVIQLPKEEFENFRKVINAAADFNKVNIVLEKI